MLAANGRRATSPKAFSAAMWDEAAIREGSKAVGRGNIGLSSPAAGRA